MFSKPKNVFLYSTIYIYIFVCLNKAEYECNKQTTINSGSLSLECSGIKDRFANGTTAVSIIKDNERQSPTLLKRHIC